MKRGRSDVLCAYCGQIGADSNDHVIAKQFFPPDQAYRGNLPQVWSCQKCNNERKQQVENGPAVLFQFGDGSEASGRVLREGGLKSLVKNRRLHASLQRGFQEGIVQRPSGLITPYAVIHLSPRECSDIYAWFQFVTRGLYCYEFKIPLPVDHSVHLFWRKDDYFNKFREMILRNPDRQTRIFASGELQYIFASNPIDEMSLWLYSFKSINVLALTLSPAFPAGTKSFIAKIEWPPP